ncbi:uncharacterized protein Z519_11906 [Cladophialophora bantiana CBS 173.52]|uniref:FAD/NAD(P)-binding domain-containing protein n=1 Tax=Cladophialophora bantiana (strain ATCC 10958 / CBS 173.52 / CDC B-1940 / NIH 8579) TaxID=1442370 RepID=A0A0D2EBW5_CLAB1|nr:uncharacterized protein Z519_11906 [Cladophialophora bantiana CBS 173.52]KIW87581.1 hypothetical protein Z519_11906 [Cladophialophora bantiana CBS 173.52]
MASSQNTPKKQIIILGGSYGGVSVAHQLLKHAIPDLPDNTSYEVVLISPSTQVMCRPACPRAMISDRMLPQEKLFVDIVKQFEQYPTGSFKFIHGIATKLDHQEHVVSIRRHEGTDEILHYYALVIATGATSKSPLLGLSGDASELRARWADFRKALPQAKSIVIGGGGPSGVETAGELGEYLNGRAGWFSSKLENPKVPITVINARDTILPQLRPKIGRQAEHLLAKVGVTVINNVKVQSVIPDNVGLTIDQLTTPATISLSSDQKLTADLYIPAFGTTPNTSFVPQPLLASDGRVKTNATTLRVDDAGPFVYALGDVSNAARPAIHNILSQIPVLAANIKRDLLLNSSAKSRAAAQDANFKEDTRETQLVPIGTKKGVGAMMGYQAPSWAVWLIKGRDYWLWTTGRLWSGKQWN